ncbi:hypothetical protein PWP93_36705, partial [Paraburkholderia sp. A1RI-2L]|uniref:hypothetical protein n=1 Tax=Paraburkholderia sp. A1RI-2L TaxID=3028367 RepID=UPI003B7A0387
MVIDWHPAVTVVLPFDAQMARITFDRHQNEGFAGNAACTGGIPHVASELLAPPVVRDLEGTFGGDALDFDAGVLVHRRRYEPLAIVLFPRCCKLHFNPVDIGPGAPLASNSRLAQIALRQCLVQRWCKKTRDAARDERG